MSKTLGWTVLSARKYEQSVVQKCTAFRLPWTSSSDPRLPASIQCRHIPHRLLSQRRTFSLSTRWRAQQAAPSMAVLQKAQQEKALREHLFASDVGILPNTFIMPGEWTRPGWYTEFQDRWLLEKKRLKTRFSEVMSFLFYHFIAVRPRPKSQLREIPQIACDLQRDMYTHLAAGDLSPMVDRLCPGLHDRLRTRINARRRNTFLRWTLVKHITPPKLMSYKAALMPQPEKERKRDASGIVQAVVRIHSVQSLGHVKVLTERDIRGIIIEREIPVDVVGNELRLEDGEIPSTTKDTLEYVVVQKILKKGEEGPWMIWGSAQETTAQKLRQDSKNTQQKQLSNEG